MIKIGTWLTFQTLIALRLQHTLREEMGWEKPYAIVALVPDRSVDGV
jgi:hypothetical protein